MIYAIFVLIAALVASFVVLFLSIFPGVLADLTFFLLITSCFWIPVVGIVGMIFLVRMGKRAGKPRRPADIESLDEFAGVAEPHASDRRWIATLMAVLVLNAGLFVANVPRRLAFAIARPAFRALVPAAPLQIDNNSPKRILRLYLVDRFAADPRGGVYFRTHAGPDGIGPDTMSYGFVFQPNPQGTPFGRSGYRYDHLFGDWYSFEASDD